MTTDQERHADSLEIHSVAALQSNSHHWRLPSQVYLRVYENAVHRFYKAERSAILKIVLAQVAIPALPRGLARNDPVYPERDILSKPSRLSRPVHARVHSPVCRASVRTYVCSHSQMHGVGTNIRRNLLPLATHGRASVYAPKFEDKHDVRQ